MADNSSTAESADFNIQMDSLFTTLTGRFRGLEKILQDYYWEQGPEINGTDVEVAVTLTEAMRETIDKINHLFDVRDGIAA